MRQSKATKVLSSLLSELSLCPAVFRMLGSLHHAQFERSNSHAHQQRQQLLVVLGGLFREWHGVLFLALHACCRSHWTYTDSTTPLECFPAAITEVG